MNNSSGLVLKQKDMVMGWLEEMQADSPTAMHVSSMTMMADYFIVASGNSQTHMRSIIAYVHKCWAREYKHRPRIEGRDSEWILLDAGAIVLHLMTSKARRFYDLEGLWSPELWQTQSL
jgi:ribosome-associated protein